MNKILKIFFFTVGFLFSFSVDAQIILHGEELNDAERVKKAEIVGGYARKGDTLLVVTHRPIVIFPERKFRSEKEKKYYYKLVYNIKKVLPYAKIIQKVYAEIEDSLAKITTEDQRKAYIKSQEKTLRASFEKQLIHLTVTQGRILIKLVDRETGFTTYEVLRELKGDFNAVIYQGIARLFGSNLKSEYDAKEEDKMIEEIINHIENGRL